MTDKLPYRRLFIAERLTDPLRRRLSWAARGILDTLEDEYWRAGNLPADVEEVARQLGVRDAEMDLLRSVLEPSFPVVGGVRCHPGLDAELAKASALHERFVAGGKISGEKKKERPVAELQAGPVAELQAGLVGELQGELVAAITRTKTRSRAGDTVVVHASLSQDDNRSSSVVPRAREPRTAPVVARATGTADGRNAPKLVVLANGKTSLTLPPVAERLLARCYATPEKRAHVRQELADTLGPGVPYERGVRIRAYDSSQLNSVCESVLQDVETGKLVEPEGAIRCVLFRLNLTSGDTVISRQQRVCDSEPPPYRASDSGGGPQSIGALVNGVVGSMVRESDK